MREVALGEQRHAHNAIVGCALFAAQLDRFANVLPESIERRRTHGDLVGLLCDSSLQDRCPQVAALDVVRESRQLVGAIARNTEDDMDAGQHLDPVILLQLRHRPVVHLDRLPAVDDAPFAVSVQRPVGLQPRDRCAQHQRRHDPGETDRSHHDRAPTRPAPAGRLAEKRVPNAQNNRQGTAHSDRNRQRARTPPGHRSAAARRRNHHHQTDHDGDCGRADDHTDVGDCRSRRRIDPAGKADHRLTRQEHPDKKAETDPDQQPRSEHQNRGPHEIAGR